MHERGITMGTNIDCREGQTVPTNADNGFTPFFFVFAIPFPAAISSNSIRSTRVDESPIKWQLKTTRASMFFLNAAAQKFGNENLRKTDWLI